VGSAGGSARSALAVNANTKNVNGATRTRISFLMT